MGPAPRRSETTPRLKETDLTTHRSPHAAVLAVGDRIHPDHPPRCCDRPMGYHGVLDLSVWECGTCQRGIGTDADGVVDYLTN